MLGCSWLEFTAPPWGVKLEVWVGKLPPPPMCRVWKQANFPQFPNPLPPFLSLERMLLHWCQLFYKLTRFQGHTEPWLPSSKPSSPPCITHGVNCGLSIRVTYKSTRLTSKMIHQRLKKSEAEEFSTLTFVWENKSEKTSKGRSDAKTVFRVSRVC